MNKKYLFPIVTGLLSLSLVACSNGETKKVDDSKELQESILSVNNNIDIDKLKSFKSEDLEKLIKDKDYDFENEYSYLKELEYNKEEKHLTFNYVMNMEYKENEKQLINMITLLYQLDKTDVVDLESVDFITYTSYGELVSTNAFKLSDIKEFIVIISQGLTSSNLLTFYDMLDMKSVLEIYYNADFHKIYANSQNTEAEASVKSEEKTNELFANPRLYELNQVSENKFAQLISENHLNLSNMNIKEKTLATNIKIDTANGKSSEEIVKIIKTVPIMYSFVDFIPEIENFEIKVFNSEGKELKTVTFKLEALEALINKSKASNQQLSDTDINTLFEINDLVKHFSK